MAELLKKPKAGEPKVVKPTREREMSKMSGIKLRDLIALAKERGLGWWIKTFPKTFGEFLEYITSKYDVDLDAEVKYKDEEHLIYAIIPAAAFRVKPPQHGLRESKEAVSEVINLLVPLSTGETKPGSIYSIIASQAAIRIPAGAFEEKTLNNRLCYAKYLDLNNIVVACQ